MTFREVEDIFDGEALLEKDGELYKYCDTAAEFVKRINTRVFSNVNTGEEIGLTYENLRKDDGLLAIYKGELTV